MGGSYYPIPCLIFSTGKDRKTPQRYPDVLTTSWRISIRSMDSLRTIDQSTGGKLRDINAEESWALLEDLALYDNESWNDPRDFDKPVKAIALPQDVPNARLSKFEADFKRQQGEMTNKIDTVLKAIIDRIAGTLPSDTVKNPKLGTYLVLSARSYPTIDPQCLTQIYSSINTITIHPKQQSDSHDRTEENKEEERQRDSSKNHPDSPTPPDPSISFITEKEDGEVMFIEIIPKDDSSHKEEPKAGVQEVEYFDIFPTRSELAYHKYLMCGPIPLIFLRNPIIIEGCPSNLKMPCNIGHVHVEKAYIDLDSPLIS
ncbi:hypothetical protein Tco_0053784 [Tanacetum coccineum]